jgi:hypothetical protein
LILNPQTATRYPLTSNPNDSLACLRIVPGSNIHMYEHGVPTTIPWDVEDLSPYVVPSYSDPNY